MSLLTRLVGLSHRYAQQPTGIAPERVKQMKMDLTMTDTREYILRPEAMESFWYMHQITGDPKYREWGWTIFRNFVRAYLAIIGYICACFD